MGTNTFADSKQKKIAAVDRAIDAQLEHDGRDGAKPTEFMGQDLKYTTLTLDNHLDQVCDRLKKDGYVFSYAPSFVSQALNMRLETFKREVDARTV